MGGRNKNSALQDGCVAAGFLVFLCLLAPSFGTLQAKEFVQPALSKSESTDPVEGEVRFYTFTDYNRTMGTSFALAATDKTVLWNSFSVGAGLSLLCTYPSLNGLYIEVGGENLFVPNLGLHLKFLGNPYAEYGMAANSIILYASYGYGGFFIDMGANFRFLHTGRSSIYNPFDYRNVAEENILYYRIGWGTSFLDERYRFAFEAANFDDFYAGNMGTITFSFIQSYRIDQNWGVFLNIRARPAGQIALSTTPYSFIFELGAEYFYE